MLTETRLYELENGQKQNEGSYFVLNGNSGTSSIVIKDKNSNQPIVLKILRISNDEIKVIDGKETITLKRKPKKAN